ncbi:MAG: phosphotransferase [Isosphaerales bacterium]
MLNVDCVTDFLREHGLIDNSWIIDGSLTIRSAARRNRNLKVEGPRGAGFLIKQPDNSAEGGFDTLRCEAVFHRFCGEEPAVAPITRILPRLLFSDIAEAVLVFELIADAGSLGSRLDAGNDQGLTVPAARALGHALGTVHRVLSLSDWMQDPRLAGLSRALPWAMLLHKPGPALLASLSAANFQTVRILQTDEGLGDRLDRLARQWRPETVIHGDIKLDNILVRPPRQERETAPVELWIADWETVRIGDPAWDLAGALQDFLVFWVSSMPVSGELTVEQMIAEARVPLEALRGAMRALWSGYRAGAGLGPADADGLLLRAVSFSAARLIQSVYEISYEADRLDGHSVVLLQIAANLLAEPELGQVQLYGIPLGWPVL